MVNKHQHNNNHNNNTHKQTAAQHLQVEGASAEPLNYSLAHLPHQHHTNNNNNNNSTQHPIFQVATTPAKTPSQVSSSVVIT
jgi:hypothetical protein